MDHVRMDQLAGTQNVLQLVDWSRLRPVLQSFYEATSVPIRLVGRDGETLAEVGQRSVCFDYHRRDASTLCHCTTNEKRLWQRIERGDSFICCPCGNGLLDSACPVMVNGDRIATVLTGQLLPGPPDLGWFADHAHRHGFGSTAYLDLIEKIPVLSPIRIRACLEYCAGTAAMLADQALRYRQFTKAFRDKPSSLLDVSQEICVCVDPSMTICDANRHAATRLGMPVEEIIGKRCYELWHGLTAPCRDCVACEAMNSGKVTSRQMRDRDGRWLDIRGYPVQPRGASDAHVMVTMVDISHSKRAQEEARSQRAELDRSLHAAAIGELATSVAHDLNQPLSAILANAQAAQRLLNAESPDIAECRAALRDVAEDAWRAGERLRRLRRMTGGGKAETAQVDLRPLMRDCVQLMQDEIETVSCKLELQMVAEPVIIDADAVQLQQVLIHLIMNACEAMRDCERRTLRVSLTRQRRFCCIEVADSGPGLSVEAADALYDLFFTTKKHAIGAGLAVARSIIEAHGGSIRAGNDKDGGACFRVRLPLIISEGRQPPASPAQPPERGGESP